jgi:trk system potassium uptake protein
MNILIIGGGTIGRITAEYFSKEGHSVTVVEHDPERIRTLQDHLDIIVVEGRGTDQAALQGAGIAKAALFLALTDNDEANIISCTLAKFAGVPHKIARINDMQSLSEQNGASLRELGIDEIVNTGESLIHEIVKIARHPGMTDIHHYFDRRYVVSKFSFNKMSPHLGKTLDGIALPPKAVRLGYEQVGTFQPYDGAARVNEFLYLYCACPIEDFDDLHAALAPACKPVKRVVIFGGGYKSRQTGGGIGAALMKEGVSLVELVEEDPAEAKKLSAKYPFRVINDDPTLPHFARGGHFKGVDLFVAISGNFEKNLYACSLAYREQVPYTIAFVRYPEHTSFVSAIPIMEFMNPALVTANKVLKYHQADTILSRTILEYGQVECLECIAGPKTKIVGKKLSSLPFKKSRVLSVMRDGRLVAPDDDVVIEPKDKVLILLVNGEAERLRTLF